MLTYRGDKFVRGKKFKINENEYRFCKRHNNDLVFEAIADNSKFVISEAEYNDTVKEVRDQVVKDFGSIDNAKTALDTYLAKCDDGIKKEPTNETNNACEIMKQAISDAKAAYSQAEKDGYSGVYLDRFKSAIADLYSTYYELKDFYN